SSVCKRRRGLRRKRLICKRTSHRLGKFIRNGKNKSELHRHLCPENTFWRDFEPAAEILFHLFAKGGGSLQAYHCHPPSFVQSLLHDKPEILMVLKRLIIRRHVCVPCYADIVL